MTQAHRLLPSARLVTALLVGTLLALGLAACDDADGEDEATESLEAELAAIPGVADARSRLHTGGDEYLSMSLDLTPGTVVEEVGPVIQAAQAAVEASEHHGTEMFLSVDWADGDRSYTMGASGPVRLIGALENEVHAMAELVQHDFQRTSLRVDEFALDAQYGRTVDIGVAPGTPDRALVRIFHALRAQLPDQQQSTRFDIGYHDHSGDGPRDARRVGIDAQAPDTVVAAVDSILRAPEPRGWDGTTNLSVTTGGYGDDPADWYVSANADVAPAAMVDHSEDELADRAGDHVVMDAAEHLARGLPTDVPAAMLDIELTSRAGHTDVGGFYSADCSQAWDDDTGRSRRLWTSWVEDGGQPREDGATATECPDA